MTQARLSRAAILGLSGLSLAVTLAGCSPTAAEPAATEPTPTEPAPTESTADGSEGSTGSGDYADGEYSATGEYQSPAGDESIEVELSLEGGAVTAVTVTPNATDGNAERYQTQFADGVEEEVVGRSIDELAVDRVAGSSLTSGGFNDALEQIKADAAS